MDSIYVNTAKVSIFSGAERFIFSAPDFWNLLL